MFDLKISFPIVMIGLTIFYWKELLIQHLSLATLILLVFAGLCYIFKILFERSDNTSLNSSERLLNIKFLSSIIVTMAFITFIDTVGENFIIKILIVIIYVLILISLVTARDQYKKSELTKSSAAEKSRSL